MILIFILSIFLFWIVTYHRHQLMVYIFHSSSDMLELVQNIQILLIEAKVWLQSCSIRAIRVTGSKLPLKNFVVDILTFLAHLVNLSHSLLMICYKFFYQSWQNLEYDHIPIMIQYCENSSLTSIMTFTYLDICKWRVALVRQDMLTRSGAPDIICLPFGWRIHFAMSFLPLLAFQPLLAWYESSLSECMVSHIWWWYI